MLAITPCCFRRSDASTALGVGGTLIGLQPESDKLSKRAKEVIRAARSQGELAIAGTALMELA
jgi:hypothetical protein